jgi:hypothetical protein
MTAWKGEPLDTQGLFDRFATAPGARDELSSPGATHSKTDTLPPSCL